MPYRDQVLIFDADDTLWEFNHLFERVIDDYLEWVRVLRALPELDGREMLIWSDVLAGTPEHLRALPDGVTVCEWFNDAGHAFDARAATYAACGTAFWTASTSTCMTIPSPRPSTSM